MPLSPSESVGADPLPSAGEHRWEILADRVLAGEPLPRDKALEIVRCPDDELLGLLAATFRVRRRHFGCQVQLYFLVNAKSGLCPEDCAYCSQSKVATAEIPRYNLLNREKLLDAAREAAERQATTCCIVISARAPNQGEMEAVTRIVPEIKARYNLKVCACLGLLSPEQARQLKAAGVDRVNHNLNTSEAFYDRICSTHSFQERMDTLHAVRDAGLEMCSGGIVGMGESDDDVVSMAFALRELEAESIPINFLNAIDGTPLEGTQRLNPRYCLKVLAMFRLVNPARELRIAGGRELHLKSLQPLALYAANSIFVGDYLTTEGQPPEDDYRMIEDMGFEVVSQGVPPTEAAER